MTLKTCFHSFFIILLEVIVLMFAIIEICNNHWLLKIQIFNRLKLRLLKFSIQQQQQQK